MLRGPYPLVSTLLLGASILAGCGAETPPPAVPEIDSAARPQPEGPTLAEARNVTIEGIFDHPVTLENGRWEGRPFGPESASRPSVELVSDFLVTGEIDGDGTPEAIVLLTERSGGSGTFSYLAILDRREGGVVNPGTTLIGDRIQVQRGRIVANRVRLDVIQQGPDDAACCPSQKTARVWELGDEGLTEIASKVTGTLSLADLSGHEWVLTHIDREAVVPPEGDLTVRFEEGRIAGSAGCNRYFAPISAGQLTGEIEIGAVGSTRKTCAEPSMALEERFLGAIGGTVRYSFLAGKLALSYQQDSVFGVLLFAPRRQEAEPVG